MHRLFIFIGLVLVFSACGNKKNVSSRKESNLQDKYAKLLEVEKRDLKNISLYQFIEEWYGVKYKWGGMSKSGVDCSGFSNVLYKDVYKTQLKRTTKDIFRECKKLGRSQLREGDFVFFNIQGKKNTHMGIYLHNNRFVHASSSKGVIISSLGNPYYKKYFYKGGRLK